MIGYLDESGDAGTKFHKGSSKWFILVMVYCKDEVTRKTVFRKINELKELMPHGEEFHFKEDTDEKKQLFLNFIEQLDFKFCAVILNKHGRRIKNQLELYSEAFCQIIKNCEEASEIKKVFFDVSFRKAEANKIEKMILPIARMKTGKRIKIYQQESEKNNLIQLADYMAGILKRWVSHQKNCDYYFEKIQKKIDVIILK